MPTDSLVGAMPDYWQVMALGAALLPPATASRRDRSAVTSVLTTTFLLGSDRSCLRT
jgi:hypothetical protein